jgi:hypothetical protein
MKKEDIVEIILKLGFCPVPSGVHVIILTVHGRNTMRMKIS